MNDQRHEPESAEFPCYVRFGDGETRALTEDERSTGRVAVDANCEILYFSDAQRRERMFIRGPMMVGEVIVIGETFNLGSWGLE